MFGSDLDLGAAIATALPELRAHAESLMLDTCTILHLAGVTTDPLTGRDTPVYDDEPVYEGRCKVQTYEAYESNPESGARTVTVQRYTLHVPATAGPFSVGDVATITASTMQPHLVGNDYRIAGLHEKSLQTAQRLLIDRTEA